MTNQQRARIVHLAMECERSLRLAHAAAQRGNLSLSAECFALAEWDASVAFLVASEDAA